MLVKYKGKIYKVLAPEDLKFPDYCIRNVLIERAGNRIITNINQLTIIKAKFKNIGDFLV